MYVSGVVLAVVAIVVLWLIRASGHAAATEAVDRTGERLAMHLDPLIRAQWLESARWCQQLERAGIEPIVDATLTSAARRAAYALTQPAGDEDASLRAALGNARTVTEVLAVVLRDELVEEQRLLEGSGMGQSVRPLQVEAGSGDASRSGSSGFRFAPSDVGRPTAEQSTILVARGQREAAATNAVPQGRLDSALPSGPLAVPCPNCQTGTTHARRFRRVR